MQTATDDVPELSESILRPVALDVINQIKDITGISKDVRIIYNGDIAKAANAGSTIDDVNRDPLLGQTKRLEIETENEYNLENLAITAVSQREHYDIFKDTSCGLFMKPIYVTNTLTINFKFITNSKTEATRWRAEMRSKASQMRDVITHDITYHFSLPNSAYDLLSHVHQLRENQAPYGETFDQYFVNNADPRFGLISNISGTTPLLVISETQGRVQGRFTFDGVPDKPDYDDGTGAWSLTFSYTLDYELPIQIFMRFPLMVHNQLMDDRFIGAKVTADKSKTPRRFTATTKANSRFEVQDLVDKARGDIGVAYIPDFDNYKAPFPQSGTCDVMYIMAMIDDSDKRSLFNLNDLGDFILDEDVLNFIKESEYPYLTKTYYSLINLQLYRNGNICKDDIFTCDSELNIKATVDLDVRSTYRVRISLVTDLTMLRDTAIQRLKLYPKALAKLIASMNETLRYHAGVQGLGDKNMVRDSDFNAIYRFLTGFNYNSKSMKEATVVKRPVITPKPQIDKSVYVNESMNDYYSDKSSISVNGKKDGSVYNPADPFKDIRGATLQDIKLNGYTRPTVMTTSILAYRKTDL